jgi:predicted TPR repeat methyltransferase
MTEDNTPGDLYSRPRSVDETLEMYNEWAARYDEDVRQWGYVTPGRVAMALRMAGANTDKLVLDVGCGTGLSGLALKAAGFGTIDGTDVSRPMLEQAEAKGVYRALWIGTPGSLGHVERGDYPILAATGVVSHGAAPPEMLDVLVEALGPGGLLAFSFNDLTLADRAYTDRLDIACLAPDIEVVFEEHGPHLPAKEMGSTVYVLKRN